jgi:hypothetical protein
MSEDLSVDPPSTTTHEQHTTQGGNIGLRLLWMAGFPAVVLYALKVGKQPTWSFSIHDVVLWSLVAVAIAARALDSFRYKGRTANGDRSTPADVVRYALFLLVLAGGLWFFGHSVDL